MFIQIFFFQLSSDYFLFCCCSHLSGNIARFSSCRHLSKWLVLVSCNPDLGVGLSCAVCYENLIHMRIGQGVGGEWQKKQSCMCVGWPAMNWDDRSQVARDKEMFAWRLQNERWRCWNSLLCLHFSIILCLFYWLLQFTVSNSLWFKKKTNYRSFVCKYCYTSYRYM